MTRREPPSDEFEKRVLETEAELDALYRSVEQSPEDGELQPDLVAQGADRGAPPIDWRKIFETVEQPICVIDPGRTVVAATAAISIVLGRAREEIIGTRCHDLLGSHTCALGSCPYEKTLLPFALQMDDQSVSLPGGAFRIRCSPLLDAKGRLESVVQTYTAQPTTSLEPPARHPEQDRVRWVVEESRFGVAELDSDGCFLFLNPATASIFGYETQSEMLGNPFLGHVLKRLDPRQSRHLESVLTGRRHYDGTMELLIKKRGGDPAAIAVQVGQLTAKGAVVGSRLIIEDVTRRRQLEAALRKADSRVRKTLERLPLMVAAANAEGRVAAWNHECERITGYSAKEVVGNPDILKLFFPNDDVRATAKVALQVSDAKMINLDMTCRDGAVRSVTWLVGPDQGAIEGWQYWAIGIEATELRRTEHARLKLKEQSHRAQRMEAIARLAGGMAHSYNNILTAITISCELLAQETQTWDRRFEHIKEIKEAAGRAKELTSQLLVFTKRQALRSVRLDLATVLRQIHGLVEPFIGEDVTLTVRADEDLGTVELDQSQIEQVLVNLVINARDAMPHGGSLTIEAHAVEVDPQSAERTSDVPPGKYVMLVISDTGVGIREDHISQVFEPFFTTKPEGVGTGLGLSTAYGIVTQSGGRISVRSKPGVGTTFTIYLPRADGLAEGEGGEAATAGLDVVERVKTILVVEDEPAVKRATVRVLKREGYRVLAASNGEEAVKLSRNHHGKIDLVLCDVIMPGMSGPQAVVHILKRRSDVRVLYMSGYTDEALDRHGVLGDGIPLVHKPFTPQDLISRVKETLVGKTPIPALWDGPRSPSKNH